MPLNLKANLRDCWYIGLNSSSLSRMGAIRPLLIDVGSFLVRTYDVYEKKVERMRLLHLDRASKALYEPKRELRLVL